MDLNILRIENPMDHKHVEMEPPISLSLVITGPQIARFSWPVNPSRQPCPNTTSAKFVDEIATSFLDCQPCYRMGHTAAECINQI
jgi:hypothetical protein